MMILDKIRLDPTSKAIGGEEATKSEIFDATQDSFKKVENSIAEGTVLHSAYDDRIEAVKKATGVELEHPFQSAITSQRLGYVVDENGNPTFKSRPYSIQAENEAKFQRRLGELAQQFPEQADIIAPHRTVAEDASAKTHAAERRLDETWKRSSGSVADWGAYLAGGFYGAMHDPVNAFSMLIGAGPAGAGVKGLAWAAIKQGAINAATEAATQPIVQSWRKKAGLPYGVEIAATNVAAAALFGAGLDATARGVARGVRRAAGKPYLGPDGGQVTPAKPAPSTPSEALDAAAAAAPEGSLINRAYRGDEDALRELAAKTGNDADPLVKRTLAEIENEKLFPADPDIDNGDRLRKLSQSIREQSGAPELPVGDDVVPRVTRQMDLISDDAAKPASAFSIEDKPVSFRSVDPATVTTDAATFQFKGGGDAAGVTNRLTSVQRWDQMSAGKAIVYERASGELVIADGHQRLGLAKRLSAEGQDAKLDAYIFREADGWTPEDVRAYAALKNMRELSGNPIDMARIMRERPDLIDGSLPLSDNKLREATMLARLSPEAFDAVVAGRLPSTYAALIGESVGDASRHMGLLNEMAAADLGNVIQARLYLKQLMELPTTVETQLTLFGEESFTRTVLVERAKVLDGALKLLRADKRIFSLLEREAKAIGAAGNVLARDVNEALAKNAAQLAELIETLATSKGTVATILNDAASAVARGLNATTAAKAFVKRVGDILDKEGINGLLRVDEVPALDIAPVRMDDPVGPEAREQIADLEAAADEQASLFAMRGIHYTERDFEAFSSKQMGTRSDAGFWGRGIYMFPYEYGSEFGKKSFYGLAYPGLPKEGGRSIILSVDTKNPFYIETRDLGKNNEPGHTIAKYEDLRRHGWDFAAAPTELYNYTRGEYLDKVKKRFTNKELEKEYEEAKNLETKLSHELADAEDIAADIAGVDKFLIRDSNDFARIIKAKGIDSEASMEHLYKLVSLEAKYNEAHNDAVIKKSSSSFMAQIATSFSDAVMRAGYDSVILTLDGKPYEIVAIKPGTVTAAFGGAPMFAIGLPGFYSPAIRAAQAIRQEKGTGEQFWKQITKNPGVKKDELDWMGLEEFLKDKKAITKEEVLAYMRAHQIELDERVLGEGDRDLMQAAREIFDDEYSEGFRNGRGSEALNDWLYDHSRSLQDKYDAKFGEDAHQDATPVQIVRDTEGQDTLDGFVNEAWVEFKDKYVDAAKEANSLDAQTEGRDPAKFAQYRVPGGENYRELLIRFPSLEGKYHSKHFKDQEIVHLRVDDRTGSKGEKVLFINEVQSDLHQAGRRAGYAKSKAELEIEFRQANAELKAYLDAGGERGTAEYNRLAERADELAFMKSEGVPDAPFKGDLWLELALKRALQYASEHGYDAVSWARSEQIAKAVGADAKNLALQYDQKIGRFLDRYTKKWGGKVEQEQLPDFAPDKAAQDVEPSWTTVEGGPVQKQTISGLNQILRITPEMRTSIADGQPLFSKAKEQLLSMHGATLSARAAESMAGIRAEIDKVVSRVLPPEWKASVRDNLVFGDLAPATRRRNPGVPPELEIEGTFDPYERIIYVSMAALDPVERAFEEAGHALKAFRLIPEADYDILRAKALEIGARERFDIDARYGEVYGERFKNNPARLESALEEEAIMQMVAARARGDTFGKQTNGILDRVIKFLRAVRDMLGIKGFRTFEDVFEDITEGRFAAQATEAQDIAARYKAASEVMASVGKGEKGAKGAEGVEGAEPKKELTPRQQGKLTRQIINEAAAEGRLTREDAASLIERLDVLEKHHKDAKKATEVLVKEIDAEALNRERQAALTEQAKRRIDQTFMNFRDARGQADPAKAMVVMLENLAQHELPQGTMSVQNHFHAIFGMAMADLDGMLHEFKKTFLTGQTSNKARLPNVVRELFGEASGDESAAVFAAAAADVMEKMRQRFNAAGGAIGKREGWALPQWHDPIALIRAGKKAWMDAIIPDLDLAKMRNPLTGGQMTAADLRQSLEWIYKNITSDGWAEKEATMAQRGLGSVANQRADHRFLVFKDAAAWMRYAERFGVGDDPLAVIVNHIKGMSKDIAAMEVLGPNPRGMLTYMQQWVEKHATQRLAGLPAHFPAVTELAGREITGQKGSFLTTRNPVDYADRMIKRAENMYNLYRGHASGAIDSQFAEASQVVRNVNVLTKLGGAAVSAVGDLAWQVIARKFAGLPVMRIVNDVVHQIAPGAEREARRAGVITETYMHMYNEAAREAAATSATRITAYVADRVLTLSMLNGITRAGNHAMSMGIMAHLADEAAKPFAELKGPVQRMLRRHGLNDVDWEAIRLDASGKPVSADFLTPTAVRDALVAQNLDPTIAERYLAMTLMEAQYATLTGTLRGRATMTMGTRPGTVSGEVIRHLGQFKAFAVNIAILQIERMAREFVSQGLWRGAQYASFAMIGAMVGGALIEQLQHLRNGKDPRDMTDPKFWGAAAVRSGGLSIWGDLLYSAENRMGGGMAQTIGGPTAGTFQDIANLTIGAAKKSLVLAPDDKTNLGRELTNTIRRYTPGTSIWYLRPAWNRIFMDNLQRITDPDADAHFRRQIQKARKDFNQEFFWAPGQRAPSRGPNFRAAVGLH